MKKQLFVWYRYTSPIWGCVVALSTALVAHADGAQGKTRSVLQPILEDSRFAQLHIDKIEWGNDNVSTKMPTEDTAHPEGIFWLQDATSISAKLGDYPALTLNGRTRIRVLDAEHQGWGQKACQNQAEQFLSQHIGSFFKPLLTSGFSYSEPKWARYGYAGTWNFSWRRIDEESNIIDQVGINVRDADGKVVGLSVFRLGLAEHSISATQAEEAALKSASKSTRFSNIKCVAKIVDEVSKAPKVVWRVTASAVEVTTKRTATALILVDASTGYVLEKNINWKLQENNLRNDEAFDTMPVWTTSGLLFNSMRPISGMPKWVPASQQSCLQNKDGNIHHLTQDLEVASDAVYGTLNSPWLSIERSGWTYALNTNTGDYRVLGLPSRPALTPAISSDGAWAIISATSNIGKSNFDLFTDSLGTRGPDLQLRTRLIIDGSDEHHPLFSPDNKWLYFVSTKKEDGGLIHRLCRIPTSISQTKQSVHLLPEQIEIVSILPTGVLTLSMYADGVKIFIQGPKDMYVVDTKTKKSVSVNLPALFDVELKSNIVSFRDGCAGPEIDEVTFSGETVDLDKKVRRRIYSCKLNGDRLRALTSKDNAPLEVYEYSKEHNATATAKEWALREIAEDKLSVER